MVYKKTKLRVGVPSLTKIPIDIQLRPYIYSPGNIWVQGSTFFFLTHYVYIDVIKKKSALYTVTRTILLYQFGEEGGSKPFSCVLVDYRIYM